MIRSAVLLACGFTLAACSSSLPSLDFFKSSPATEALRIESKPPGAEAKTTLGQSCRTPCELKVQPGSGQTVTVTLNGYQPHTVPLRPEADDATKLAENPIFVELKAVAPASSKKKQAAAKKKPNTAPVVEADATPAAAER